jgi:hypothetical protein
MSPSHWASALLTARAIVAAPPNEGITMVIKGFETRSWRDGLTLTLL